MDLITFRDQCTITRTLINENGAPIYDEYDEPITELVYEGNCYYQSGGQINLSITVGNDRVYLPLNDVAIYADDMIDILTVQGRRRRGVVNTVRDIEMPLTHELLTHIEVKQGTGN